MRPARIPLKLSVKRGKDRIVITWNDIIRRTEREVMIWVWITAAISGVILIWMFFQMWQEGVDFRKIAYASRAQKQRLIALEGAAFAANMTNAFFFPIIWGGIVIAAALFLKMSRARPRRVAFTKDNMIFEGHAYPLDQISRIAYAPRGEWDGSDPEKDRLSQIRIWFQDDYVSIVVAENNWLREYNHEIQQSLERAILTMRSEKEEEEQAQARTAEAAGHPGFGIPVYQ